MMLTPALVLADRQEGEIHLIPVSEVAAKDEFNSIKNHARDDVLASCAFRRS